MWPFLATDLLLVSRGQLTHRHGRRHATWPRDAQANADKITGRGIKCNFVHAGPADKAHAGFERTSPGFYHRVGSLKFSPIHTERFKVGQRFGV